MEIVFLGTSCMQPTKERSHPAVLLVYGAEHVLMDCGEGTQRQLRIAGIKPNKITKVLITHWHADHTLGLAGLIQTMGAGEYDKTLMIYGPKGSKQYMSHVMKGFSARELIPYEVHEVEGKFLETQDYFIESHLLDHEPTSQGYRFVEKDRRRLQIKKIQKLGVPQGPLLGKLQDGLSITWKGKKIKAEEVTYLVPGKIVGFLGDTKMCNGAVKVAKDADVFISESTYASDLQEKAEERMHLTAKDAGFIAAKGAAKKLVLTHFSTRYKETAHLVEEAKEYVDDVIAAYDFLRIKL